LFGRSAGNENFQLSCCSKGWLKLVETLAVQVLLGYLLQTTDAFWEIPAGTVELC